MEFFDARRTVNFQLEPDPEFAGQVKSSDDRYGRTVNNSGFPMTYAIVHVVHGLWEPAQQTVAGKLEPSRASLIVIRFELARLTSKSSRRFVSFNSKLRFEADPYTEPINDPWVAHFEPAGKGKRYITESESNVTHQKAVEVSASLNAAPAPVTGGATYTHTKSEEFTKIKRYEIGSGGKVSQSRGAGRNGRDEIWWNLTEDEGKGVGDRLQVAVLVKRKNMSNFKIHLTLRAHVDGLHSLTTAFKDAAKKAVAPFHSLNTFTEVFSPTAPNNNIPAGIDPDNLSHIEKDGTLDRLAFEHSAEKMHSAILYPEETKPAESAPLAVLCPKDSEAQSTAEHPTATATLAPAVNSATQQRNRTSQDNDENEDEDEDEETLQLKLNMLEIQLKLKKLQKQKQKPAT